MVVSVRGRYTGEQNVYNTRGQSQIISASGHQYTNKYISIQFYTGTAPPTFLGAYESISVETTASRSELKSRSKLSRRNNKGDCQHAFHQIHADRSSPIPTWRRKGLQIPGMDCHGHYRNHRWLKKSKLNVSGERPYFQR